MATTVDNLSVDHEVLLLRDVRDVRGTTLRTGHRGIIRELTYDELKEEVHLSIVSDGRTDHLVLPIRVQEGPRLGHYKEFFEVGNYVPVPGTERVFRDPASRTMIVPTDPPVAASENGPDWWSRARALASEDRIKEAEQAILRAVDHIGSAASVAEMYADRMRFFQRMGDEPRAVEAFKKAVGWMGSYAASATSGGEGAALSYECERFHEELAKEFGYDPLSPSV